MMSAETASTSSSSKTPIHLWIVAVISLLWNAMGAFDYLATHLELEFYVSQFTEAQLAYFQGYPSWAVAFWAFGVWGAFVGSIGLLMRAKWSFWSFAISLLGLAGSSIYSFGLSNGAEIMGSGGMVFNAVIWLVAILLLLYSKKQVASGVLR